jgi:hypothetical protein
MQEDALVPKKSFPHSLTGHHLILKDQWVDQWVDQWLDYEGETKYLMIRLLAFWHRHVTNKRDLYDISGRLVGSHKLIKLA